MINNILFSNFLSKDELKNNPYFIPLGIVYCATIIKQNTKLKVDGKILYSNEFSNSETFFTKNLINHLVSSNIDIFCLGGLSIDYLKIKKIINSIKVAIPNLIVVLGGGIITADPKFIFENINADFGIIGEGEVSLLKLFNCLTNKTEFNNIEGLVYKKNEEIYVNRQLDILDLNSIPFPDFSIFKEFEDAIITSKIYPILLSRSCIYNCSFCFHTSGLSYRFRSLNDIVTEIVDVKNRYSITHLFFLDELFGSNHTPSMDLIRAINKMGLTYNAQTRADEVTEEKIILYSETGCTNLSIGIETISDIILSSMGKNVKFNQIENALLLTNKYNLKTSGNIIIGDILETKETALKSIEWYNLNKDKYNLTINMIQCYPGSRIFNYALKNNLIIKDSFLNSADIQSDFIINITKMNCDDFANIRKLVLFTRFNDDTYSKYIVEK